jgi:hypothetical protein
MSSDGSNIEVKFTARTDGVEQGAATAKDAIQNAVTQMREQFEGLGNAVKGIQSQISGVFSGLQAGFAQFNNVMFAVQNAIAGGSMFKEFVASSMETTKEAVSLSKAFGVTATEASYMRAAAAGVGVSFDSLMSAGNRITRTLLANEDAFKNLGVATRDQQGHFRNTNDVMMDVNRRLLEFNEGTDRNVEGMKIYGREWANIAPLVTKFKGVTEESRREAEALNLVVGQEAVAAMADYRTAQLGAGEVMEGIKNTIGQALMPGLTNLANWFRSVGPAAVEATRIAMHGYLAVQETVKETVLILWAAVKDAFAGIGKAINAVFGTGGDGVTAMEFFQNVIKIIQIAFIGLRIGVEEAINVIKGVLDQLANEGRLVGNVIAAALHGDWQGVKNSWAEFKADTTKTLQATMDEAVKIAAKGRADIDKVIGTNLAAFKPQTAIAAKDGGERSDGKDDKDKKAPSELGKWEAINKAAKDNYELENGLKHRALEDDIAYWQSKLAIADKANGDLAKVELKIADTKLQIMKRDVAQGRAMSEEQISDAEKAGLDAIALTKAQYDQKLQLGLITKGEMIAQEQDLENQKLQILMAAQQARIAMVETDPNHSPVALQKEKDKLLEIERKYEQAVTQLRTKAAVEDRAYANQFGKNLETSFSSLIQKFAQGTLSVKGLLIGMGQAVLGSFTQIFADIAARWLASQIMQRIGGTITALGQISAHAAVAGAAAFASIAAIPIVGPMMAPAAGMAAYAGAMSFASMASIPAAAKGYDIPAGVNPLTQLHEKEMVLPQRQADVIRSMADNGGGNGSPVHIHINALDAKSVARMFHENGGELVKALKTQGRNFAFN